MNVKYKTTAEAVAHTLGRNVGVLPLGSQLGASPGPSRVNSVGRKILKRTSSTGSIGSLSSCHTRPKANSASTRKQSARRPQIPNEESQKSTRLVDNGTADRSCAESQNNSKQGKKAITTNHILKLCLETEPGRVFEINLHGKGLTSCPELERFNKLRILDLSSNHIKRISGLDSNMDLCELKIYDNNITTIEGLEQVKELCCLQLQHNRITAIGRGLNNLKKLQYLRLDNNQISRLEIPELLSCSNITSLDLSHNRLESLGPLSYLPNLEELFASRNRIQKTGDLARCKKLQEVDLARNQISELPGLANLPKLQILDISHNHVKNLKSVGILRSLEELNMNGNKVEELSSFSNLFPSLQILHVCDNLISKWDEICSLSECIGLVELGVSGNPFMMENGVMPNYHHAVPQALPSLEVIDGVTLKKPDVKGDSTLVMRPMTASSIISIRQIDSQLKATTEEQSNLFREISKRFEALRSLVETLPSETPRSSCLTSTTNRCNSRSRLAEARNFAAMNFDYNDK